MATFSKVISAESGLAINFPPGMNVCMGVTSGAHDWPPFLATERAQFTKYLSFWKPFIVSGQARLIVLRLPRENAAAAPSIIFLCVLSPHPKGPSIYDVRKILGFFDPLPPLSAFGTDLQY